ncbi:beta strand repeat-containing protein [Hyalangium versicolor]|uniref:beta strand repeat-containing protein n=1 Tax=Hyalangium versicolor TaxID=2861190 RepID=UPI001CCC5225|nr:right-handed parallel beta-helix repeat-containing protein [Hyalangium versicolor]
MSTPRLLALLLTLIPAAALATTVSGSLPSHTTWTPAGNPWVLTGDVTVPAGVILTIEPGVQVTFSSTDSLHSGNDTSKVELIVVGSLYALGTSAAPINITATNAYGVSIEGWANLDYTNITGGLECLGVYSGTLSFTHGTLQNCSTALGTAGGTTTFTNNVVRNSGNPSASSFALEIGASINLIHNTITGNNYGGVRVSSSGSGANIYDNIITSNGEFGIYFTNATSPTRAVHHNDVWNHPNADYTNVSEGTGSVYGNPLFVSSTNFHITEYSPARLMASDGTDLGAFAYAGDPATSLQGALVANKTLTGANTLAGDLTIRPGVTLTLAPGASLTFASTDGMLAGEEPSQVELLVDGTLNAEGTSTSPVTITGTGGFGTTVRGTANFNYATLNGGFQCLGVYSGTASFTNGTIANCSKAFYSSYGAGTTTITNSVVRNCGATTQGYFALQIRAPINLIHNTVVNNIYGAIKVFNFTGAANIYDNIITSNSQYGIYFDSTASPARAVHHNDVWNQTTNYTSVTAGTGSISANPVFVSSTNFNLQESSPCRNIASDGTDLGAFPYTPVRVAYVTVTPSPVTLAVQGTQQFSATAYDSSNNPLPFPITWSATSAAGSINSSGLFTANCTPGTYTAAVTATSDGKSASADVTLTPGAAASVTVSPSNATVQINGTQQFTANVKDACNNPLPTAPVSWAVTTGGGTINSSGLFTAGTTPGTFTNTVRAFSGTLSGTASVTVTSPLASIQVTPSPATLPINGTEQFTATGKDSAGNTVPVSVTWSVVNGGGSIDASGLFTAGTTPGTFTNTLKATNGTFSGFATVTVQPGALASIEVTPNNTTLSIHGTQQFTAIGKDSAGNIVPVSVTWGVLDGGGSIDPTGLFTAGTTPGVFTNTVRASNGTLSGFATVTVQPGALASIELTPASATLEIKGTQQFTATGKDSAGNTVPVSITWSIANGGGSVDAAGLFTAGTVAGSFAQTVKASSGSLSATASVTVNPGTVHNLEVAPASVTLPVRGTRQFTASATDSWGNTVPGTPTWTVLPATAGSIDATGFFTAGTAAGSYLSAVTATLGGVSASADVTISASALARIVVSPASLTVEPQGARSFSAQGQDTDGNAVPITPVWSVMNGAGTISQDGLFTATQVTGTYLDSVVATANGVTGTASVVVAAGGIQRVALSPLNPTVAVNGTIALSAKAFDALDNVVTSLPTTWEVVNGGGSIDASGIFTAGAKSGTFSNTVKVTLGGLSATTSVTVATDFDGDGLPDEWEVAHGLNPNQPGDGSLDMDSDKLSNLAEFQTGTDPHDADTDDDGVLDGNEQSPSEDSDGDGLVNALDPDSDNDGLFDGTEMAVASAHANTDTSKGSFIADVDPATSTSPLLADTDKDGRKDSEEDANHNGKIDPGETDPNHADTFCSATPECGDGQSCQGGVCVDDSPSDPDPEDDSGCGCSDTGAGASAFSLLLLSLLGRVGARRKHS